jgi:DNA invertase Pin-like site-specific DNA recombinase
MIQYMNGNGARTILVESASRFARDLIVQEVGFAMLKERGIDLIAADNPSSFLDDTPTTRLIRQMLGAFAEFEKAMLVAKLKGARDRKRRRLVAMAEGHKRVKVEGRKSIAENRPETAAKATEIAKEMTGALPKGHKPSLRDISAALAKAGHTTPNGLPYSPSAIARMLGRKG